MGSEGSYRLREHFRDVEAELARLEAQAAIIWPKEAEVLRRQGLPVDARVLEVGCGPGFVTERLLRLVSEGSVTAIDNDPEMVTLARRRLGGFDPVEVLEASVLESGFEDATFDAATARLVFQHLPDPEAALAELHRVLRPGARLFITDGDGGWGLLMDPEPPHLDEVAAAFERLRGERGGDLKIGRKLPRLLAEAGFADLALDVVAIHSVLDGADSVSQVTGSMAMLERLADAGLISRTVFDDLHDFVERFERGELEVDGLLGSLVVSGAA
ncbi:MAG TPA: methyltransferase domain-containing protein [Gaiellaceae bacterium]